MSNDPRVGEIIVPQLEACFDAKITRYFDAQLDQDPDVLAQLLADKRNPNTKRAYEKDIRDFFGKMTLLPPSTDSVLEFLHLQREQAVMVVLKYKAMLIKSGVREATINRRLAAIKSLAKMGRKLGVCNYSLEDVEGEKVKAYRDTRGVDTKTIAKVIQQFDRETLIGKRNYAIFMVLWGLALRRHEVCQLNVGDFDFYGRKLRILGKGQGTNEEYLDMSKDVGIAIAQWLIARGDVQENLPIFTALDFHNSGHRLTADGIYKIVSASFKAVGVKKPMSPHRVRHSAITAALDATDGNIRKVQKLSRHADPRTLMIYDDNRNKDLWEMSELLTGMLNNKE
ncbi:tyrosine-type recombinase/integrase [Anabaena cylindrica FACHB-243]|uniref:Integrase family protein n=1 Tax=Anabaena cylindrica (strain ATCC 27899 / PCC 7122) TaxID=272123 RepID=K9ZGX2_ANACC|nr:MULTISPECIES: tyrosine-type recombinase/integrase [Anabaena]AFZ57605.1 integrase family protein [Anabaena cylindrica PCC 7122]MBD2421851.1 tyrosine-type recombinase/integrase [Anabaena cylindrica FACHB-243]MBY5285443.1 tyrosine-type recombinase/integrase [Anabaena sp. CCAP 1446/1C]MBY5310432.1 tyrosine-type recombinase/integrase [Anabaena sp. CCAP 1446/1C]MCM2409293.1 tyrosine-type recombinase/integrase [Anabaena sp. CCAP 1446/1C]